MQRIKGWTTLTHDLVDSVLDLVDEGHESTSRAVLAAASLLPGAGEPARRIDEIRRAGTRAVLSTIRGTNRLVAGLTDGVVKALVEAGSNRQMPPVPMRSDAPRGTLAADQLAGVLNGIAGDYLDTSGNPLAEPMRLRWRDTYLPLDAIEDGSIVGASTKVAVFVHGLATTEWSWCLNAEASHGDPAVNFGTLLERDLGYSPVWVRYNSGRPIADNGMELSARLDAMVAAWPVPVEELVLVGHSMGGLVSRSACERGGAWRERLRHVFCLGSPHEGADLERGGDHLTRLLLAIDHPATRVLGRIGDRRSAGIKDLRYGLAANPLPGGCSYHYIASTLSSDRDHPIGQFLGDLLVRLPSAHATSSSSVASSAHIGGIMHQDLANHPAVYAKIHEVLVG